MEWNHFLPQCIFGDQPIGHYLLLKQHAIASALQTLAFKKNCMCGWHKKFLPNVLLDLSWVFYIERNRENGRKVMKVRHLEKDENGKSLDGTRNAKRLNARKNEEGKSVNAVKGARRMNEIIHAERDEFGRSLFALRSLANTYQEKDERGIPVGRIKNAERLHAEKDELGRSVVAMRTNTQVWESLMDGYRSNAGGVAIHNKHKGWDPGARVRIS